MIDPSPALRMLLDLPLRVSLEPAVTGALGELEQAARKPADWAGIYRQGLGLAEQIVADCDRRMEEAQRKSLSLDEAAERARNQQGPRRLLDAARAELRAAQGQLKQDWRGRLQRQQEQLQGKVIEALASLTLELTEKGEVAEARPAEAWLLQLGGYVEKLSREWRAQAAEAVPASLAARLEAALAPLRAPGTGLGLGEPPRPVAPAFAEPEPVRLNAPAQSFEVPPFGAALLQYVRGHLMTASMMGTMLFAAIAAVISLSGGQAGSSGMNARGWLLLLALPPSLLFGVLGARKSRRQALEKGREAKRQAISTALGAELQRLLQKQLGELERGVGLAVDAGVVALEAWLTQSSQAALQRAEAAQQEQLRAHKLEARALQDRAGEARTLKSQLSQSVLPEIRRRLRDLSQGATG